MRGYIKTGIIGRPSWRVLRKVKPGRRARRSQSTPTWSCFPTLGTESPIRTPTTDGEDFRCSVKRGASRRVDRLIGTKCPYTAAGLAR
jgi:hypothetical protein